MGSTDRRRSARARKRATVVALCLAAVVPAIGPAAEAMGPVPGAFGVPAVPDSAYAIPTDARFVALTGSDTNPGTQSAPWRTIGHAIGAAPTGATVVVRAGTYREQLGSIYRKITLQAYPHEQVWVSGAVVIGGFTRRGSVWVRSGWNPGFCRTCFDSSAVDPAHPAAGLPDQVFFDGTPLYEVATPTAVGPGRFYVDPVAHELVVGTDPNKRIVEASVYAGALSIATSGAAGTIIRGIGFTGFASYQTGRPLATLRVSSPSVTLDHIAVAHSGARGVMISAPNITMQDSLVIASGFSGVGAHRSDGLRLLRNRIAFSNAARFAYLTSLSTSSIAGSKITASSGVVIRGNVFDDNTSNGLWIDVSSSDVTIVGNSSVRNARHGISIEISTRLLVAGNTSADNVYDGLKVSGATAIDIWNNTFAGNGGAQLGVYEDPRSNPDPVERANGLTWDTASVRVFNNLFVAPPGATKPMMWSFDATAPRTATVEMVSADDHNLWARPDAASPRILASWASNPKNSTFLTMSALRTATGREASSTATDALVPWSLFVDPTDGNYTVAPNGPASIAGRSLPGGVATALGVAAGAPPHLGALASPPTNFGGCTLSGASVQAIPAPELDGPYQAVVGDFDGDDDTDVHWYGPGATVDREWHGTSSGPTPATAPLDARGSYVPVAGDFDGDGATDIYWYAPGTASDAFWRGGPNGLTTAAAPLNVAGTYTPVAGDFDGDGTTDIYWYAPGSTSDALSRGSARGLTAPVATTNVTGTYTPVAGDFDGNGTTDIYWYAPGSVADNLWRGTRTGFTNASLSRDVSGIFQPVAADIDGNHTTDIYWYAPAGPDTLWLGGAQGFAAGPALNAAGYCTPVVGHFDAGPTDDIVWFSPSAPDVLGLSV